MSQAKLETINVFPVKSVGGISMSNAFVEFQGLVFDRRFMLAKPDGSMVTARKYPQLLTIKSTLLPVGLRFTDDSGRTCDLRYDDISGERFETTVWKDTFIAYKTRDRVDDWFSTLLGEPVHLLFSGEQSNRHREKLGHNVSFADGYPLLLISEASLEELNRRCSVPQTMTQFRTNLVASGVSPFAEDSWKTIRVGDVVFDLVKPCERCIMTTANPNTGKFDENQEPLKTLSTFRANEEGGVFFGQNLVARNEGVISVDDEIEVLEYHTPPYYEDKGHQLLSLVCVDKKVIARDFFTYKFEPQNGQKLKDFFPGQHLPITVEIGGLPVSRRYTISSAPAQNSVEISVKRVGGGLVSNWLADNLSIGDELTAEQPTGDFYLGHEHHQMPICFLSAGSGITPMLSMLRSLTNQAMDSDIVFYHQCSTAEDLPHIEELREFVRTYPSLKVLISFSQPTQFDADWCEVLSGRISLTHIKQITNVERRHVFTCGPDAFMEKAKALLLKKGVPEEQYHQERFAAAKIVSRPYTDVLISVDGQRFVGNNQQTILEQAEDKGIAIQSSCRAGLCGACRVNLEKGQVEQADTPAAKALASAKLVLACCCVPNSDIEITR